jgi:hypothetical protein
MIKRAGIVIAVIAGMVFLPYCIGSFMFNNVDMRGVVDLTSTRWCVGSFMIIASILVGCIAYACLAMVVDTLFCIKNGG